MELEEHYAKREVFRKHFDKLKDGFSCCIGISNILYSKGVINPDIRDSKDPDKILSAVEKTLWYNESVWEILIEVMIDPPLDSIADSLKQDLTTKLELKAAPCPRRSHTVPFNHTSSESVHGTRPSTTEFRTHISPTRNIQALLNPPSLSHPTIPTSLPLDRSDNNFPDSPIDSGCISSTTTGEKSNYPKDYFPKTSSTPLISSSTFCDESTTSRSHIKSQNEDSGRFSEISESIDVSHYDMPDINLSIQKPNEAVTNNDDMSISELVNPQIKSNKKEISRKRFDKEQDAGLMEVQILKLKKLEKDKVELSDTLQQLQIQMAELEIENDTLLDKWRDDQQLLQSKLIQLAQDNQILSQQIKEKFRLEGDNRKLKHDMKLMKADQERLENENSTLRSNIEMAERVTSIQAVNIDRLRETIVGYETEVRYLKEQIQQRNELLTEMENHICSCYTTLYTEDTN